MLSIFYESNGDTPWETSLRLSSSIDPRTLRMCGLLGAALISNAESSRKEESPLGVFLLAVEMVREGPWKFPQQT